MNSTSGPAAQSNPWVREHFGFDDLGPTSGGPAAGPRRGRRRAVVTLVAALGIGAILGVGGHAVAAAVTHNGPATGVSFTDRLDAGPDGGHGRGRR